MNPNTTNCGGLPVSKTIPFNCSQCGHKIGPRRVHIYVPETKSVWCLECFSPRQTGSVGVHARIHTECPHEWHDMYDHWSADGDRAFMALWLATTAKSTTTTTKGN